MIHNFFKRFRRANRRRRWLWKASAPEILELRALLVGDIVVSEFMAANDSAVQDYDNNSSDWIELRNDGLDTINLKGWYLTDSPTNVTKWSFPRDVEFKPNEHLVVFASGRDRVAPNGEFHTNFQLNNNGEYLAVVRPDGQTISWDISPRYPVQHSDVSFGNGDRHATTHLITRSSRGTVQIPSDESAELNWTTANYDDTGWASIEAAVGFAAVGGPVELSGFTVRMIDVGGGTDGTLDSAREALDVLDGKSPPGSHVLVKDMTRVLPRIDFGGFRGVFDPTQPYLDGTVDSLLLDDMAMRAAATVTIPAGDWTIGFGSNDGGILRLHGVSFLETFNEDGDAALVVPGDGELLFNGQRGHDFTRGTFTVGPGGLTTSLDVLFFNRQDSDSFELIFRSGLSSQRPRNANRDEWTVLENGSLNWRVSTTAIPDPAVFSSMLTANVESLMRGKNSSAYIRFPFDVADASTFDGLNLRLRYNDAFVAYLNGVEVTRDNYVGPAAWNSVAAMRREDRATLTPVDFDINLFRHLLRPGKNVLAIQGMTAEVADTGFFVLPELWGIDVLPDQLAYFGEPTPSAKNSTGAAAALSSVEFSQRPGPFNKEFALELYSDQPGADIHYTTDGTLPSDSSLLYTNPIPVRDTTQIRARAYFPDRAASEITSHTFVMLANDLRDFTSDMPILVLENYDQGVPDRDWQSAYAAVFEPLATGRSSLNDAPTLTSRIAMHGRGFSTFTVEKTTYRIEFRDEHDDDRNVQLLGLPEESDFTFLAPWIWDKTMVRNSFMFELGRQLGHYEPRTRFVEVFSDTDGDGLSASDYMGVYIITETVKVDSNRVDIAPLEPSDITELDVSGGYLIKNDRGFPEETWNSAIGYPPGQKYVYVDPKPADLVPEQKAFIQGYVDRFEAALFGPAYRDPEQGYHPLINFQSFIDFHWLRLLSNDPDGLLVSTFWHVDRGGPITMGPLWDFDRTMGSDSDTRSANPRTFIATSVNYLTYGWWGRLFTDVDFAQRWVDRYQELRRSSLFSDQNFAQLIDFHTAQATLEARTRNHQRWPTTVPDGGEFADRRLTGFAAEVSHLKNWLHERLVWMDSQFTRSPAGTVRPIPGDANSAVVEFQPQGTSIYYTLDGGDPRLPSGEISPSAIKYTEPVRIPRGTIVRARSHEPNRKLPFVSTSIPWSSVVYIESSSAVPGDANGDLKFDSADLVAVFQAGEYEDTLDHNSSWNEGDWNGDGDFTTADLVEAFQAGGYSQAAIWHNLEHDSIFQLERKFRLAVDEAMADDALECGDSSPLSNPSFPSYNPPKT